MPDKYRSKVQGPGTTSLHGQSYFLVIRMLAENFPVSKIVQEIHTKFPEHRADGDSPITYWMVKNIKRRRNSEVEELRGELNTKASKELWIANRFSRLKQLQNIFEDANRWIPKRAIQVPGDHNGGPKRSLVVYEKEMGIMLKTLAQAREELGEDGDSRQAQSLEDLVKIAEQDRGLELTETVDVTPGGAAPKATDAELVEAPEFYPTAGADETKGILAGDIEVADYSEVADEPTDG